MAQNTCTHGGSDYPQRILAGLPGKQGELKLLLGVKHDRTVIKDVYQQAPLKIAKPFYLEPETGQIFIYQMNPSGGLVQGDSYYQEVELEEDARAYLTTQSATKVYRMPDAYASQVNVFKLGKGALLEYFPDPVIPFAESRFRGETEIYLTTGATAFIAEVITPGRFRRNETFCLDYYHSKTKAYWDGELILWDFLKLEPSHRDVRSLGVYDGFTHQGNLFIFSEKVTQALVDSLNELLADKADVTGGASLSLQNGIAIRVLGYRADMLVQVLAECWNLARYALVGRYKPHIRK